MSDFHINTDIEVEDVASEEEGYHYEYEEPIEEINEFGSYDPNEAAERWGSMEFDQLIVEMEGMATRGKKYFFSKTKRVVDGKDITNLCEHIQERFPEEIRNANDILTKEAEIINSANEQYNQTLASAKKQEDEIIESAKNHYVETIAQAKKDAETIIAKAKAQAEAMMQEHNITRLAREEAARIESETTQKLTEYKNKVFEDCEAEKAHAKNWAAAIVRGGYNFVLQGLHDYQKIANDALMSIDSVHTDLENELTKELEILGINKNSL